MRLFLALCAVAAALAIAVPATAASRAPASATITIVIPAFPAASVSAAIKKALKGMPSIHIVQNDTVEAPPAPPGALKFAPGEINRATSTQIGKIISLYPATLPKDRKGHLIVVHLQNYGSGQAVSVVQPDSKAFTLHQGERIVLVRSRHGWARILPYNGPNLSRQQR